MKKYLLVSVFCTILLIGCGDSEHIMPSNTTEDETTVAVETKSYPEQLAATTFEGRTFTMLADAAPLNLPPEETTGEQVNDALYYCWMTTEEYLDITLNGISTSDPVGDTQRAVLAGDLVYNAALARPARMSTLVTEGILQDLNEVPVLDLSKSWWCQGLNNNTAIDGTIYITTGSISQLYFHAPFAIAYNHKLAEIYLTEDINTVVTEGRWTLDYMKSCTVDVTADLNGDGVIEKEDDQYAIATEEGTLYSFATAAGFPFCVPIDGSFEVDFENEKYVNILNKITDVVNPETTYYGPNGNGGEVPFMEGRALFYRNMIGWFYNLREMEDDYGIIPMPKYDENQIEYISPANPGSCYGLCIPFGWSEEDSAFNGTTLEMLCWLCNEYLRPAKIEIALKQKMARDPQSIEMLNLIYDTTYYDLNTIFNFGGSVDIVQACIRYLTVDQFISDWVAISDKTNIELNKFLEFSNNK